MRPRDLGTPPGEVGLHAERGRERLVTHRRVDHHSARSAEERGVEAAERAADEGRSRRGRFASTQSVTCRIASAGRCWSLDEAPVANRERTTNARSRVDLDARGTVLLRKPCRLGWPHSSRNGVCSLPPRGCSRLGTPCGAHERAHPSAASSLPVIPPKPPLLITRTWSRAWTRARSRSRGRPGPTSPGLGAGKSIAPATSHRGCRGRTRDRRMQGCPGSASFIAPSFIVLDRGSSTATMREAPVLMGAETPPPTTRWRSDDERSRRTP